MFPTGTASIDAFSLRVGAQTGCAQSEQTEYFYTKAAKGAKQAAGFTTKYTKDTKVIPASVFLCVHLWLLTLLRFPFALIRVSSRLMNQTGFNAEDAESAESLATKGAKCAKQVSESVFISEHQWLINQNELNAEDAENAEEVTTKYTQDTKVLPPVKIRFIAWSSRPSRAWCNNSGYFHHGWHGFSRIICYRPSVLFSVNQWFQTWLRFPFALIRVYSRLMNQTGFNAEGAEDAEGVTTKYTKTGSEFVSIRVLSWLNNLLRFSSSSPGVPA